MNRKTSNDILLLNLWNLSKVYLLFLSIFLLFRIFFVYYYGELEVLASNKADLIHAFYLGWKYDNLVICYIFLPIVLFQIILAAIRNISLVNIFNYIARIYFSLFAFVVVLLLISDMGFYNYFQDHINILFYGMIEDDTSAIFETLQKNYPIELLLCFLVIFFVISSWQIKRFLPKFNPKGSNISGGAGKFILFSLITLILLFGGLRGGYSILVISPKYSDFSDIEFINQVSLNGIITLENAVKLRATSSNRNYNLAKEFGYGNNINQAFSDYLHIDASKKPTDELIQLIKRKTLVNDKLSDKKLNVVILLMESFGGHWIQYNQEGFNFLGNLKKHFDEDYYFPYSTSEDNGTIGSLMAISTNIPNRPGARFLSESRYMQMPLETGSHIPYQKNGFETSFYYGGKLGWRDIGKYFRYQKYQNLVGENAIKKDLRLSGEIGTEWGVYDGHLFNSILKKLKSSKNSQFMLALSTTNHPPFEIPKDYPDKTIEIPKNLQDKVSREKEIFIDRFKAFEYSNQVLAQFLTEIKSSSLADNTIVAITGDHNFWGFMNYSKQETYTKHTVPLYFYIPKDLRPKSVDLTKVSSHKDIATTLYGLSLSDTEYLSFGTDLFSESKSYAFNQNLYASSEGIIYKNQEYEWNQFPLIDQKKSSKKFEDLRKVYRSTLTVADYYLRMVYQKHKTQTKK
jgi:phosphoglycerol transferase MdoB-like AlkP superfamily enzyme